jgi:hypothetical protein
MSAGLPGWAELLDEMRRDLGIETKESDLLRIAWRIEQKMGVLPFRQAVARRLSSIKAGRSDFLDALANLPVNVYMTTNYDHLLDESLHLSWGEVHVVSRDLDISSINPSRKTVVKLHGDTIRHRR